MPIFICLYLDYAIYITVTTYLLESSWFLKETLDYVPCFKTASHLILNDFNTSKYKLSHFLASYLNTSAPMMLTFILLQLHIHEHEYILHFVHMAIMSVSRVHSPLLPSIFQLLLHSSLLDCNSPLTPLEARNHQFYELSSVPHLSLCWDFPHHLDLNQLSILN